MEGIVHSMTAEERRDPDIIDSSRRRRIARGCGRDVQEVASLIKTFRRSREMMQTLSAGGAGAFRSLFSGKVDLFSAMSGGVKLRPPTNRRRDDRRKKKKRR
jgi:signal recognition particle subunit SRP54